MVLPTASKPVFYTKTGFGISAAGHKVEGMAFTAVPHLTGFSAL
jgi:hypothetical protein